MSETPEKPSKTQRLEEEGDVAADYLEEILDIADLDGDIEIDIENGRASVAIVSDEPNSGLEVLVGQEGRVLEALQELTRLAVQAATGERSRLMLDVAGFRAARKVELRAITQRAVEEVRSSGEAARLEPMNPFERKVCHDVVAAAGLRSESEGVEPNRYLVVLPVQEDLEEGAETASAQAEDTPVISQEDDVEEGLEYVEFIDEKLSPPAQDGY